MSLNPLISPLLRSEFGLDEHARQVIATAHAKELAKALVLPTDDPRDPERLRRVKITWDELNAQPEVVVGTLAQERAAIREAAQFLAATPLDRIIMTGCGDSLASMDGVRYAYERLLGLPVAVMQALDFAYYHHHTANERTLVITLSSSGATTRTVEAMMMARRQGAKSLSLSNTPGSLLMVEADRGVLIHAARRGWPTQSSTAAMATLFQFMIELAAARGVEPARVAQAQAGLDQAPAQMAEAIAASRETMRAIASLERDRKMYVFAAAGPSYAAAIFGAAKVKECTPDLAEAVQMEEFHHYNSLKAHDPLFVIAPDGMSVPRAVDTAREGKRWGGQIYSLVTEGNPVLDSFSDVVLRLPAVDETYAGLVYAMPTQLFGYYVAMAKFEQAEQAAATGN